MKKYNVEIREVVLYSTKVEALDPNEAEDKALELFSDGTILMSQGVRADIEATAEEVQ